MYLFWVIKSANTKTMMNSNIFDTKAFSPVRPNKANTKISNSPFSLFLLSLFSCFVLIHFHTQTPLLKNFNNNKYEWHQKNLCTLLFFIKNKLVTLIVIVNHKLRNNCTKHGILSTPIYYVCFIYFCLMF